MTKDIILYLYLSHAGFTLTSEIRSAWNALGATQRRTTRRYLRTSCKDLEPTSRDKQHCKMADIGILLRPPHAAICLVLLAWIPRIANSNERKNVLVIIGDDAGFETQVYDNTVCKTPNLNALGKRSVIFRKAFTSVSSCSPSRSAILTGKF